MRNFAFSAILEKMLLDVTYIGYKHCPFPDILIMYWIVQPIPKGAQMTYMPKTKYNTIFNPYYAYIGGTVTKE